MPLLSNKLLSIGLLLALVFALAALAGWFTVEANPQGILLHTPAADGTPPMARRRCMPRPGASVLSSA